MDLKPRTYFIFLTIACLGMLAFAYYLQHVQKQRPCPYCILQRMAFLAIAASAFAGAIFARVAALRSAAGWLVGLLSLVGLGFGVKLVFFTDPRGNCMMDPIGRWVNTLPSADWWPEFFVANGSCGEVHPPILGLSVPVWALIMFTLILLTTTWVMRARGTRR